MTVLEIYAVIKRSNVIAHLNRKTILNDELSQ